MFSVNALRNSSATAIATAGARSTAARRSAMNDYKILADREYTQAGLQMHNVKMLHFALDYLMQCNAAAENDTQMK